MSRFWAVIVLACTLAFGMIAAAFGQAAGGVVEIESGPHPGVFVVAKPGAPLRLAQGAGTQWQVESLQDGGQTYLRFKALDSGGYLNTEKGPPTVSAADPGWYSAMWMAVPVANGRVQLQNRYTSMVLNATAGTVETVVAGGGQPSARWVLMPAGGTAAAATPTQATAAPPAAAIVAQAAPVEPVAASGTVLLTVSNDRFPQLGVYYTDTQGKRVLLAQLKNGQQLSRRVAGGGSVGFASNGQKAAPAYPLGTQTAQSIAFNASQTLINGMATDAGASAPEAAAPAQVAAAAPSADGSVQVTIINGQYPVLQVMQIDEQNQSTPFATLNKGQRVKKPVKPGGTLAFASGGQWVVPDGYTVTAQPAQQISFDASGEHVTGTPGAQAKADATPVAVAAQAGPAQGQVTVKLFNRGAAPFTVSQVADNPGDAPDQIAGPIAVGGDATVHVPPGSTLTTYNPASGNFVGNDYKVTPAAGQNVVLPYIAPGNVQVTVTNTLKTAQQCQLLDAKGNPDEAIGRVLAGQSMLVAVAPGRKLGFLDVGKLDTDATNVVFSGGIYTVTSAPKQSIKLPQAVAQVDVNAIAEQVAETIAANMLAEKNQSPVCWKATATRGVGIIPTACVGGYPDAQSGLCYQKCQTGYKGAVTMCVPVCPPSFRDDGLYCYKPAAANRFFPASASEVFTGKGLDPARGRCRAGTMGSKAGCTDNGVAVYANCAPGFSNFGDVCSPVCPKNTTDVGVSCQKNTYDRGVGQIPSCGGGTPDKDAGLCYKACQSGSNGVGPVCWGSCPATWTDCGAMCGSSQSACVEAIANQASSTAMAAVQIGSTIVTAGGAAAATAAADAGEVVGEEIAKVAAKAAAEDAAKALLKTEVKSALLAGLRAGAKDLAVNTAISAVMTSTFTGSSLIANDVQVQRTIKAAVEAKLVAGVSDKEIDTAVAAAMQAADANLSVTDSFDFASLDPTGIASVVMSFIIPMCPDIKVQ